MGEGGPAGRAARRGAARSAVADAGAGGVHHVAFRTPDDGYDAWAERLNAMRIPNSGKVDRFWFRSLYFREPNGILFEIASDGPGFAVDEPSDARREGRVGAVPGAKASADRGGSEAVMNLVGQASGSTSPS